MRAAVFVKQVPDIRLGSVATKPDGTIDRGSAPAILNPVDLHAVEAALQLADDVVAITMGPAASEAVLREAIAHGATTGALVTDRAFAGSDTWATANVLAAAVEAMGARDLYVCGLSALDGETGQVGPQIAERLGIPHVTAVEAAEVDGAFLWLRRVVDGGYETIRLPLPALLTIAETGFVPRYPTWPLRRAAMTAEIIRFGATDLELGEAEAGLQASPTKVAHMEMAPLPALATAFVGRDLSYESLASLLRGIESIGEPVPVEAPRHPDIAAAREGTPKVWVVCERSPSGLAQVSAELLTKAREIADATSTGVAAIVLGDDVDRAIDDASTFGADVVFVARDDRLRDRLSLPATRVLCEAVAAHEPEVMLFGATSSGRDLAPRVAARLDTGLAADCTDLFVDRWTRRGLTYDALLHQVRPAMGSSVMATCLCPEKRPQMATVRPGVFAAVAAPRRPRIEPIPVNLKPEDMVVEVVDRRVEMGDVRLADANVIVAGGAGCTEESWHLIESLASTLGGRVAASRAAVDAQLAPRALQVGQTGISVSPDLYIACGISGAFQHVVGMRAARTVVVVNRDPDAAMFRYAHYGIVGDVADVLPRLTEALRG